MPRAHPAIPIARGLSKRRSFATTNRDKCSPSRRGILPLVTSSRLLRGICPPSGGASCTGTLSMREMRAHVAELLSDVLSDHTASVSFHPLPDPGIYHRRVRGRRSEMMWRMKPCLRFGLRWARGKLGCIRRLCLRGIGRRRLLRLGRMSSSGRIARRWGWAIRRSRCGGRWWCRIGWIWTTCGTSRSISGCRCLAAS